MRARLASVLVLLVACAPAVRSSGMEAVVTERLYFGRNIGDTLGVSDSAWSVFVTDVVSARLPGFTMWPAMGEWRAPDGRLSREPSFVLEVVHSTPSPGTDSALATIIAEYKRRFRQESVLRVITPGRASF